MSADSTLEQLQRDVQYLKDRLAIQDCIMRLSRGVDRHDAELMTGSFHPDAEVKHGNRAECVRGADYGQWSNGAHEGAGSPCIRTTSPTSTSSSTAIPHTPRAT